MARGRGTWILLSRARFAPCSPRAERGVHSERANLASSRLVATTFKGAAMLGVPVGAADLAGAVLRGVQGREQLRGLRDARNANKVIGDPPRPTAGAP